MQCPICRQTNPNTSKLCEVCGSPLHRVTSVDPDAANAGWHSPPPPAVAWQQPPAPPAPQPAPAPPQAPQPYVAPPQAAPRYPTGSMPAAYPSSPTISPAISAANQAAPARQESSGVPPTVMHITPESDKPNDKRTFLAPSVDPESAAQPVRAVLLEQRGPLDISAIHILRAGPNPVGRSTDCPVRLDDHQISKLHATIVIRGDEVSYMDVSSNGSIIDGQKLNYGSAPLRHGSVLCIGSRRLVLLLVPEQSTQRLK